MAFPWQIVKRSVFAKLKVQSVEQQKLILAASQFVKEIEAGNIDAAVMNTAISGNALASSLESMRLKLKAFSTEARHRQWRTEGLAKFGDLLRSENDIKKLSDRIIQDLVKYIDANHGALFLLDDTERGDVYLELSGCYAYGRKKFIERKIYPGDGLVGQAYLEKSTQYFTAVPADYIKITSGLGEALPRNLLIVPLKNNGEVLGVLELAAFGSIGKHKIEFVESLAESIAGTISSLRSIVRTEKLLRDTQRQAEHMQQVEEEMRQSMEELTASQEEQRRQITLMDKLKQDLEIRERVFGYTTILSEADIYGTILMVNDKLCQVSGYTREELIGKPHNIFRHPDMPKELFKLFWETIKKGNVFNGVIKNRKKDGSHYWVDATIVPVKNKEGKIVKFIGARYHIIEDRLAEYLYKRQIEEYSGGTGKPSSTGDPGSTGNSGSTSDPGGISNAKQINGGITVPVIR